MQNLHNLHEFVYVEITAVHASRRSEKTKFIEILPQLKRIGRGGLIYCPKSRTGMFR